MSNNDRNSPPPLNEKSSAIATGRPRADSVSSVSLRSPRTARFAEATSVNSPIDPPKGRNPFQGTPIITTTYLQPQPQVSDIGFGYMSSNDLKHTSVEVPLTPKTPMKSGMKSALKVPGTPGRMLDPRSPTFQEEVALEKEEEKTDKQNATDLKVKKRVRVAKFFLRGVNFSCSLIVLSMLSTTFTIFNATKSLPARSTLPAWAPKQQIWPQITLLCISCLSLAICIVIFYSYWKGGHRKAQKTAVYYTTFAIGFFVFSTVMWIVAAVILHTSRSHGNNKDMWGWSCNNSKRETLFKDTVNYALVCRMQNWTLICALIEIIVEVITIAIYAVVFYRVWSKRKLHKSMNMRDKARSDLYLAQLRTQSAPNTPGFSKTPLASTFNQSDNLERGGESDDSDEENWAKRHQSEFAPNKDGFQLQPPPPPVRVQEPTPVMEQGGFESINGGREEHMPAAEGEQTYASVPIPGAYATPSASHFPEESR